MLRTALVVDDDYLEREYLTELLIRNGFAVRSAASAPNAAALARTMRFDCFFIDDRMSGGNGAQTLSAIRRAGDFDAEAVPAVLLGDARDASAQRFREDGFAHFLEKPVDIDRLLSVTEGREEAGEVTAAPSKREEQEEGSIETARLAGLDVDAGIAHCGSEENYFFALKIFYDAASAKAKEIEEYYNGGDWKNYTIKVHALKSNARIIGAAALSEAAAALEAAGNGGDIAHIRRETASLLDAYRKLIEKLTPLFVQGAQDDRPPVDEATLTDALRSVAEFAEQMDYDLVEMVLKSMEEFRLPEAEEERFARIRAALLALDWDAIRKEVP